MGHTHNSNSLLQDGLLVLHGYSLLNEGDQLYHHYKKHEYSWSAAKMFITLQNSILTHKSKKFVVDPTIMLEAFRLDPNWTTKSFVKKEHLDAAIEVMLKREFIREFKCGDKKKRAFEVIKPTMLILMGYDPDDSLN